MSLKYLNRSGLLLLIIAVIVFTSGCAAFTEHRAGLVDGMLTECPQWPRCVSSQETDQDKLIEPYRLQGDVDTAWREARSALFAMPRTTIVAEQNNYIHAEVISPWRFYTDDFELLLEPAERVIQVRSSGRIGYYDFNVNRDRVEALRSELTRLGVTESY